MQGNVVWNPGESAKYERSFRRGVHHAIIAARQIVERAATVEQAVEMLGRAEDEAQEQRRPSGANAGHDLIDVLVRTALEGASSTR
jgi:hypothetical protein